MEDLMYRYHKAMACRTPFGVGPFPGFLFLTAVLYLAHSIALYLRPKIFGVNTDEKDPLTSTALTRVYATRTFLFSIVRLYASSNILESALYDLSFATFAIELVYLVNESMVFGYGRKDFQFFLHFAIVVTMIVCSWWCRPYHVGWVPLDLPC